MHRPKLKTVYRVECPKDKKGLFCSSRFYNISDTLEFRIIRQNFTQIKVLWNDFDSEVNGRDITEYKCAFKTFTQMLKILPLDLIKFLVKAGFEVVEIKGEVIESETQAIFIESEVRKKKLSVQKVLGKLAQKEAKKHLKKEFKTLKTSNYIILNDFTL